MRHRRLLLTGISLLGIFVAALYLWDTVTPNSAQTESPAPVERIGVRAHHTPRGTERTPRNQTSPRLPFEPRVPLPQSAEFPIYAGSEEDSPYPGPVWRNVTVEPGDNLSLVFNRVGASRQDMQSILELGKKARSTLVNLSPGQVLRFRLEAGNVQEMVFEQDFLTSVRFHKDRERFSADWVRSKPEIRLATAVATINHSLFIDGQKAGLTDKTIMEFIKVFGWDVDFLRDLQRGDQFSVVFEEFYKDGKKFTNGKILAAEFVNRGKRLRTVYYDNNEGVAGYFSDKGDAMRKAFLRTPVNFTRISSRFSLARRHPLLNRIRAHKGVDYSAPTGTPIQSVADGKVSYVGWRGGYGNVIQLKHGDRYSTLYGHMSKFARGIRAGSSVSQGQIIGYVGRTGLATGPHLHYEFLVNGAHHDPLTVKLPNSLPLDRRFKGDFLNKAAPLLARLDTLAKPSDGAPSTMVAKVERKSGAKRSSVD